MPVTTSITVSSNRYRAKHGGTGCNIEPDDTIHKDGDNFAYGNPDHDSAADGNRFGCWPEVLSPECRQQQILLRQRAERGNGLLSGYEDVAVYYPEDAIHIGQRREA